MSWILAVRLGFLGARSDTVLWFRVFLIVGGSIYVSQGLAGCVTNPQAFTLLTDAYSFCVSTICASLIVFVFHFTNQEHILRRLWVMGLIAIGSLTMLWLNWTGLAAGRTLDASKLDWGFRIGVSGAYSSLMSSLVLIGFIVPVVVMFRYDRRVEDRQKKKETRLIIWAIMLAVVPALLAEILVVQVLHGPHLTVAPVMSVAMGLAIYWALTKYGLHIFNPNNIAGNIMQIMPAGLIITDHTNSIQYASTGAASMLGHTPGAMTGFSLKKLLRTQTAYKQFQRDLENLAGDRQLTNQETTFYKRDGSALPVSVNASNVMTNGELTNRLIAFTDISHLKQTQAALAKEKANVEQKVIERTRELSEVQAELSASVSSLPFGFAIIGRDDDILFANSQLSTMMERPLPTKSLNSKAALTAINEDFKPALGILDCIETARTKGKTVERNVAFGARFYHFLFIPIMRENEGKHETFGTVLLMEDTTEERALERSRDEFFSIASHELRTPLTAIRGNAAMIMEHYKKQLEDRDLNQMVSDIHSAGTRLIDIVNDFLDTSRLEQGRMNFSNGAFSLPDLLKHTLREYDVTSSRRKIALKIDPVPEHLPLAYADRDRVRQILVNLISNALKYTNKGSVRIGLAQHDGRIKISVIDTGKGIPEESQHLLFRKFQQASNNILTRDNTRSTGLGLYISKLMAEGMGGRLYLESTEIDKGSIFVLELPLDTKKKQ